MTAAASAATEYDELDRLCRAGAFEEAIDRARALLRDDPLDRLARLYELLIRVVLYGPAICAAEIERLRSFTELSDAEKNLVRKILAICYDAAERQQDTERMWAYQRLLRRLVLNQTLEMPIPPMAPPTEVTESHDSWHLVKLATSLFDFTYRSIASLRRTLVQYLDSPIGARPGPLMFTLALITVVIIIFLIFQPKPEEKGSAPVVPAPATLATPARLNVTIAELIAKTTHAELQPLDKRDLHQWIEDRLPALNRLYASRLKEIANLAGEITVEITVDANGNIDRIHEDSSNLIDVALRRSILEEVNTWRFPKFDRGPVGITLKLLFSANAESLTGSAATKKAPELPQAK